MRVSDGDGGKAYDRGFLSDRAAVGYDASRVHLQFYVIQEPQGFQKPDMRPGIDLPEFLEALPRPRMSRYDDRETIALPDRLD